MTIPLAPALLMGSSNLPGDFRRAALERLPIWSCSVWGFACHACCQARGALLPHLFTLTPRKGGRYIFCATSPSGRPARELPGTLPCGVRTFLSRMHFVSVSSPKQQKRDGYTRQRSPGQLQQVIISWGLRNVPRVPKVPDVPVVLVPRCLEVHSVLEVLWGALGCSRRSGVLEVLWGARAALGYWSCSGVLEFIESAP